jgi:hypothetical protein
MARRNEMRPAPFERSRPATGYGDSLGEGQSLFGASSWTRHEARRDSCFWALGQAPVYASLPPKSSKAVAQRAIGSAEGARPMGSGHR